jgi:hypothetical protein
MTSFRAGAAPHNGQTPAVKHDHNLLADGL